MSSDWAHDEEIALLDAIIEFGFGNWEQISKRVTNHGPNDCENHYLERFINNPNCSELKVILLDHERKKGLCANNCKTVKTYIETFYKHSVEKIVELERKNWTQPDAPEGNEDINVTDVATPNSSWVSSGGHYDGVTLGLVPGYNPARSEFDVEYDNKAELILNKLCDPDGDEDEDYCDNEVNDLVDNLKFSIAQAYNFRLSERFRRKRIIRNHALIDQRKSYSLLQRFENICGRSNLTALLNCMRFLSGPQFEYLLESIKQQRDLRTKINKLISYRKLGMKFLSTVPTYEKLFKKRMKFKHELESQSAALDFGNRTQKRVTPPLVLHHLPGYSQLEDEEKELCSNSRIVPETFLEFKRVLIQECEKLNGLKLAQARPLFKIDVNKTRKLYDYLMSKNLIWMPKS